MQTFFVLINALSALLALIGGFLLWRPLKRAEEIGAYLVIAAVLLQGAVIIRVVVVHLGK